MKTTSRVAAAAAIAGAMALAGCPGPEGASTCEPEPGHACVWAGTGELGLDGDPSAKPLREARLYWPVDVEFDPSGTAWVLDWNNHIIRRVDAQGHFETVVGFFVGDGPDDLSDLTPAGAPGLTVSLNHPTDIQFDSEGRLIFAAWHNHKIRRLDPATGMVHVISGLGPGFAGDGMMAPAARYNQPKAIALAPDGTLYVLDQRNFRVRAVAEEGNGAVSTVVGTGMTGFSGDGGDPLMAQMAFEAGGNPEPSGALAVDGDGNLYIADSLNHRIRKVDFAANTIETIAGTGVAGFSGDGGPATMAMIDNVRDLEIDGGRLVIADTENHRIRAIDLATGMISTIAGTGLTTANGEGRTALETNLNRPFGVAFDSAGTLYISDTFNSRILTVPR
jgi:sugar lactone lactonase YvrE